MSVKLMDRVFDANLDLGEGKPAESTMKLVLLTLANHGSDAGESIYPSLALLQKETGLSKNAVWEALKAAKDAGILRAVGYRRQVVEYTMSREALEALKRADDRTSRMTGAKNDHPSRMTGPSLQDDRPSLQDDRTIPPGLPVTVNEPPLTPNEPPLRADAREGAADDIALTWGDKLAKMPTPSGNSPTDAARARAAQALQRGLARQAAGAVDASWLPEHLWPYLESYTEATGDTCPKGDRGLWRKEFEGWYQRGIAPRVVSAGTRELLDETNPRKRVSVKGPQSVTFRLIELNRDLRSSQANGTDRPRTAPAGYRSPDA